MRFSFDTDTDAAYIMFVESDVYESDEVAPGIIIDYDENGSIVGIEILHISQFTQKDLVIANARSASMG